MSTPKKRTTKAILEEQLLRKQIERAGIDIEDARFTLEKRRELSDQFATLVPLVVQYYTSSMSHGTAPDELKELFELAISLTPDQVMKLEGVLDADQFETVKRMIMRRHSPASYSSPSSDPPS